MIEPQQPAERTCPFERIRDYPDCYEDCPDTDACPNKHMQPVKGELAPNPFEESVFSKAHGFFIENPDYATCQEALKAQFAHMIAQGYRKLPSEDDMNAVLLKAHDNAIMTTWPHKTTMAQELLKLLREQKP